MKTQIEFFQFTPGAMSEDVFSGMQKLWQLGLRVDALMETADGVLEQLIGPAGAKGQVQLPSYINGHPGETTADAYFYAPKKIRAQESKRANYFVAAMRAQDAANELLTAVDELRLATRQARTLVDSWFARLQESEREKFAGAAEVGKRYCGSVEFRQATDYLYPRAQSNISSAEEILNQAESRLRKLKEEYEPAIKSEWGRQALNRVYRLSRKGFCVASASRDLAMRLATAREPVFTELPGNNDVHCLAILSSGLTFDDAVTLAQRLQARGLEHLVIIVDTGNGRVYDQRPKFSGDTRFSIGDHDSGSVWGGGFPPEPLD